MSEPTFFRKIPNKRENAGDNGHRRVLEREEKTL